VRILVVVVAAWSVAMVAGGLATSYTWLLLSRLVLGVAVGAASPVIASLIGDLFRPADRARILGLILSGEVIGAGVGLVVAGDIGATLSWRYAFVLLGLASAALAVPWAVCSPSRCARTVTPGSTRSRCGVRCPTFCASRRSGC